MKVGKRSLETAWAAAKEWTTHFQFKDFEKAGLILSKSYEIDSERKVT